MSQIKISFELNEATRYWPKFVTFLKDIVVNLSVCCGLDRGNNLGAKFRQDGSEMASLEKK